MIAVLAFTISLAMGCPPNDPGTIVVVGGNSQPLLFNLPSGVSYRVNSQTGRLALWFNVGQSVPVTPNVTYQAPVVFAHGDMNANGRIDGADIQLFVAVFTGANTDPDKIARADFDANSVVNSIDTTMFVSALLSGASVPPTTVTLYAQGILASAALCDTPVDVSTDPNGTGMFTLADTRETTVVALTLSPLSGPVATPVTATISPAITPLAFDSATTAVWSGVYDPSAGPPSSTFSITFNAAQVREQTTSTAVIILGDGTPSAIPGPSGLMQPGIFVGELTVSFQPTLVTKQIQFNVSGPPFLAKVIYTDTSIMTGVAQLGGQITETPVLYVNQDTMIPPSLAVVQAAGWAHMVPVVFLEENAITTSNAPATVSVRVATFDASDAVVAQTATLTLTRVPDPDGDPNHIIYAGDLNTPLVLLDVMVNPANYPGFAVLFMPTAAVGIRVVPTN